MRLNELIAKSLGKPVEALTIEDVNAALLLDILILQQDQILAIEAANALIQNGSDLILM